MKDFARRDSFSLSAGGGARGIFRRGAKRQSSGRAAAERPAEGRGAFSPENAEAPRARVRFLFWGARLIFHTRPIYIMVDFGAGGSRSGGGAAAFAAGERLPFA